MTKCVPFRLLNGSRKRGQGQKRTTWKKGKRENDENLIFINFDHFTLSHLLLDRCAHIPVSYNDEIKYY